MDHNDEPMDDDIKEYHVISHEELTRMMKSVMIEVTNVMELPESLVRVMLNRCDWDKEKLYEKYFGQINSTAMSQLNVANHSNDRNKELKLIGNEFICCLICYSEVSEAQMASLQCGHQFCFECWQHYITSKINDSVVDGIGCPDNDCEHHYVDDNLVYSMIADKRLLDKYHKLMSYNFVVHNKYLRWCTYPDCSNIIQVRRIKFQSIKCNCGHKFCFQCSDVWHEPTRCDLLKMWRKKCSGEASDKRDSETIKWMLTYTKDCPKCSTQIEKNGGCNHMSCSRCRYEFCWLCLNDWKLHTYSSCNQFVDNENDDIQSARALLERYIHHWTRFNNHENSLNAEKTMCKQLCKQLDESLLIGMTCVETKFIERASEVLCNCRQTLMFSYPFAYYVFKNNQSIIFGENQSNLELNTEKLSHHLEAINKDINNLKLLKANILDETNYCQKRCQVLIDHVNEGYDQEFWHFYTFE